MSVNQRIPDYDLDDLLVVTAPEQLRALADPLRSTLLELLLERAATVNELAVAVGRPKSSVAYHVNQLVDAGLLRVVRTRRVRAIEERFYGRVARTYYVGALSRPEDKRVAAGINGLAEAAAESAAAVLGHRLHWLLPGDAREQVEQIPEALLVRRLDELVDAVRPRAVATHWDGDSHADHARTARAAIASSRRWGDVTLLQFGPNETRTVRYAEFVPTVYVPLPPPAVEAKRRSIEFYNYAGQGHRRLDSQQAEARDAARGFEIGAAAAEAFRLVRTCGGLPFLTAT